MGRDTCAGRMPEGLRKEEQNGNRRTKEINWMRWMAQEFREEILTGMLQSTKSMWKESKG